MFVRAGAGLIDIDFIETVDKRDDGGLVVILREKPENEMAFGIILTPEEAKASPFFRQFLRGKEQILVSLTDWELTTIRPRVSGEEEDICFGFGDGDAPSCGCEHAPCDCEDATASEDNSVSDFVEELRQDLTKQHGRTKEDLARQHQRSLDDLELEYHHTLANIALEYGRTLSEIFSNYKNY